MYSKSVIIWVLIQFLVISQQVESDNSRKDHFDDLEVEEEETPCPNVPLDRDSWCKDFQKYTCNEEDQFSISVEKKKFMKLTDMLHKMDCMFDLEEPITGSTVESKWTKIDGDHMNRWSFRLTIYSVVLDEIGICKNCTEYDVPKTFFACMADVREHEMAILERILNAIKEFMKTLGLTDPNLCEDVKTKHYQE